MFFFFKQKTAYEMRISDWSSDVCSSDLVEAYQSARSRGAGPARRPWPHACLQPRSRSADARRPVDRHLPPLLDRSPRRAGENPPRRRCRNPSPKKPPPRESRRRIMTKRSEENTPALQSLIHTSYDVSYMNNTKI